MTPRPTPAVHQIRFCTTADGVKIAYATAGSGLPLVKTPNWLNHLELDVESVVWRGWMAQMAERFRLIRYDARGCGLSDRDALTGNFETNLIDLEAVVDAAGLTRFALFGASQGSSIAVAYAARHPDRVSHLILCGAYLRGILKRDPSPAEAEEAQTLLKMVELGWGRENSAFRQVFATQFIPDSSLKSVPSTTSSGAPQRLRSRHGCSPASTKSTCPSVLREWHARLSSCIRGVMLGSLSRKVGEWQQRSRARSSYRSTVAITSCWNTRARGADASKRSVSFSSDIRASPFTKPALRQI